MKWSRCVGVLSVGQRGCLISAFTRPHQILESHQLEAIFQLFDIHVDAFPIFPINSYFPAGDPLLDFPSYSS